MERHNVEYRHLLRWRSAQGVSIPVLLIQEDVAESSIVDSGSNNFGVSASALHFCVVSLHSVCLTGCRNRTCGEDISGIQFNSFSGIRISILVSNLKK